MFTHLHEATTGSRHTVQSLTMIHNQLQAIPSQDQYHNELQRADLSVTQQWVRLMLWKLAVSQINLNMDPHAGIQSMLFPMQIARDLLSNMTGFSNDALEAHGPGMELKLFEFADTIVNVMVCVSGQAMESCAIGPQHLLVDLSRVYGTLRGGDNTLLPRLQSRLADVGLSVPSVPRFIDVTDWSATTPRTRSSIESDEVVVGDVEENDMIPLQWPQQSVSQIVGFSSNCLTDGTGQFPLFD